MAEHESDYDWITPEGTTIKGAPSVAAGENATLKNGTAALDEELDIAAAMDDWIHLRNLPPFGDIFRWFATLVNYSVDWAVDYLFSEIIFNLAVVEAPQVAVERAPWSDDKKSDGDESPALKQTHERSITSSLRGSVRHLHRVGGPFAVVRGLACHICISNAVVLLAMLLGLLTHGTSFFADTADHGPLSVGHRLRHSSLEILHNTAMNALLASWQAAFVHIVITPPTLRIWYRRLPPFIPAVRATWLPFLLGAAVDTFAWCAMPGVLKALLGLEHLGTAQGVVTANNARLAAIWLLAHAIDLGLHLPLVIALTRVQASLLPDEEETIVPFDRSFGTGGANGLRPGLLAEPRGALSFEDAWASVTWAEWVRIVRLMAKMFAVRAAVNGVFWCVVGNEAWPRKWIPTAV